MGEDAIVDEKRGRPNPSKIPINGNTREGLATYKSAVGLYRLFREGYLPIDVALISVSPPDEHGFCSYGVEVGVTKPAVESACVVIAEINPHMPRVWGQSFIHLSQITWCVPVDYPLPSAPQSAPSATHEQIGRRVAGLINDGDTLQIGIGAIPDAVLRSFIRGIDYRPGSRVGGRVWVV